MIELTVLGTIGLRDADGAEARRLLVRPKVMALLTYLAVAEPAGFHQRNSLLAHLWPESDERRARFSLRNALHTIRTELGPDAVVVRGDDEVAIGPAIRCDAIEFEQALADGRLREAALLYKGPLLNGFIVAGLAEYQQWLDTRRDALRRRAVAALTTLAEQSEAEGDLRAALEWVERIDAIAPYEEVVIRRRLVLLERLGDRVAAGRAFDRWAARLRADVDSEPSEDTVSLVARIRGAGAAAPVRDDTVDASEAVAPRLESWSPAPASAPPGRRSRARAWAVVAIVVVAISATAAAMMTSARRADRPLATKGTAVLPFAYQGAPESEYLGAAMASLVAASFGTAGPMAAIDQRAVSALAGPPAKVSDMGTAPRVATSLGARYYVVGSVVTAQHAMRVEAALYDVTRGGDPLGRAVGEGSPDSVFAIADRVARDLVAAGIGAVSSSGLGTTSVVALREYLAGEQSLLTAQYGDAADHFDRAVHADPSFARGYYRLGYAAGWGSQGNRAIAATNRAVELSAQLDPRDRDLLMGWEEFLNGDVLAADRIYEKALAHDSRNIEAWLQIGELRFHWGAMMGFSPLDAEVAFRHVLALSPNQAVALIHLARTLGREQPVTDAAFDSVQRAALALQVDPAEAMEMTALGAVRHADSAAARLVVAEASRRPEMARILVRLLVPAPGDGAVALSLARSVMRGPDTLTQQYGAGQIANILATRGRYAAAIAILDTLARDKPAEAAEMRAWMALLPLRTISASERATARAALIRHAAPNGRRTQWMYLQGALAIQDRDTVVARQMLARLSSIGSNADDSDFAASYRRLLSAELLMPASPDRALAALESNSIEPGHTFPDLGSFINARERFLRAQMLASAGRSDDALRWLSTFPDPSSYDTWFLPAALLQRAELKSPGDHAGARQDYTRLLDLLSGSDAELAPIVASVRTKLGLPPS